MDQFLFIYVCSGDLHIKIKGKSFTAYRDQVALLDCHFAHKYFCTGKTDFLWFHFNGNSSVAYSNYLYEQSGVVFSWQHATDTRHSFNRIPAYSQEVPNNEHLVSMHISRILARLASPDRQIVSQHGLEPAVQHIRNHYDDIISLDDLAAMCHMSTSHFIRSFNKYLNRNRY